MPCDADEVVGRVKELCALQGGRDGVSFFFCLYLLVWLGGMVDLRLVAVGRPVGCFKEFGGGKGTEAEGCLLCGWCVGPLK